jgi:hypothetical protein
MREASRSSAPRSTSSIVVSARTAAASKAGLDQLP